MGTSINEAALIMRSYLAVRNPSLILKIEMRLF